MARTLHFRGQPIGDGVKVFEPDHQPQTRAVVQAGLYQPVAVVNTDSTNMLYALLIVVYLKKATVEDAVDAVGKIQELQNGRGLLEIKVDGVVKMNADDWALISVSRPNLRPGHGGRFTDQLQLRFEGSTPPALQ